MAKSIIEKLILFDKGGELGEWVKGIIEEKGEEKEKEDLNWVIKCEREIWVGI